MKVGDLVRAKDTPSAYRFGVVTALAENGRYCWVNFMSVGYDKWFHCDVLEIIDDQPGPLLEVINDEDEKNDWNCTPTGEQR